MQFTAEYAWIESHLNNDPLWLDNIVNRDNTFDLTTTNYNIHIFDLTTTNYNILSFLTSPFFLNINFFLNYFIKFSLSDILILNEIEQDLESKEFFELVMLKVSLFLFHSFFLSQLLFYITFQDFIIIIRCHPPELILALLDFIYTYWWNSYQLSSIFYTDWPIYKRRLWDFFLWFLAELFTSRNAILFFLWYLIIFD